MTIPKAVNEMRRSVWLITCRSQTVGNDGIKEVDNDAHTDKSPERELKTRLLERGEPLRELVASEQTSQDCHDYRDDQRNKKRRKIEREHDNFLLMSMEMLRSSCVGW